MSRFDNRSRVSTYTQSWVGGEPDFGAFESIATTTLSTATASVTFSSIPADYKHLQIRGLQKMTAGDRWTWVQFNGDSGTNYSYHSLRGNGSTVSANGQAMAESYGRISISATQFGGIVVDILDYRNTSKLKVVRSLYGYDNNGSGTVGLNSSAWNNTNAITSIVIGCEGSDTYTQYSSFTLYGIKG